MTTPKAELRARAWALPRWKLVLGALLWLAALAAAVAPALVAILVGAPSGPPASHATGVGASTLVAAAVQLAVGSLALRGRRVPGAALWGSALLPWAHASALAAWAAYGSHFDRGFDTLLGRGAYASAGLLFGVLVVSGLALLGAPPDAERRPPIAPVGLAVVVGSASVLAPASGLLRGSSTGELDAFVVFAPAWIVAAVLVLALRRRARPARGLDEAFALSIWGTALWGLASVLGALSTVALDASRSSTLDASLHALRLRALALACQLVAAALLFAVLPLRRLPPLAAVVAIGCATTSGWFATKLVGHVARQLRSAGYSGVPTPLGWIASGEAPSRPPPAPAPSWPYALPLEPEGVEPIVPTDADRLMADAEEPAPSVPELPEGLPEPLPRFARECDGGNGQGCANLARLVTVERVGRAPLVLAAALLDRGCRAGSLLACGRLGQHMLRGWGVRDDARSGLDRLEVACAGGVADSCGRLGAELAWGRYVRPDWERGGRLLEAACADGAWHACAVLQRTSSFADRQKGELDDRARQAAKGSCGAGDVEACGFLDYRTPGNIPGGVSRYDVASLRGDPWSTCQKELPLTCELERMKRDPMDGCRRGLYEACDRVSSMGAVLPASCRAGSLAGCSAWVDDAKPGSASREQRRAEACRRAGVRCGEGADASTADGVRALESACPGVAWSLEGYELDLGACAKAARAYQEGTVVPRNVGRALELYRRGCWKSPRFPSHAACVAMADIFLNGDGVARDFARGMQILASDCQVDGEQSCARIADHLDRTAPEGESEDRRQWRERFRRHSR